MYNKNLGRFTTADEPFMDQYEHNPQSWNLYSYTRNNPLNSIDPTGEAVISAQQDCPPNCINETVNVDISKGGLIKKIIEAIFGKSKPKPSPPPQQPKDSWWDSVKKWWRGDKNEPKPNPAPTPQPQPKPNPVPKPTPPDLTGFSNRVSAQKQKRHLKGSNGNKGYLNSQKEADEVYDAIKNGNATYLGTTSQGHHVYRYNGVTGFNNNPGAGYTNQPTNVFMLKGSSSPSIVPTNPNFTP